MGHQSICNTRGRLKVTNVSEEIQWYQEKWRNHLERMEGDRFHNWHSIIDQRDDQNGDEETKIIFVFIEI